MSQYLRFQIFIVRDWAVKRSIEIEKDVCGEQRIEKGTQLVISVKIVHITSKT